MGCSVSLPSDTALPGVVQSAHRHAADWQLLAGDTTSSSGPGGRLLHRWLRQLLARDATVTRIRDSRAVCLVESGDVKELDGAEPSGKEEEGEEAPGALKWRARAVELADATLPFLPARVSVAFTQGGLEGLPPAPRRLHAALLIVDVSGFTALSEDAGRRLGSEGVERFSIALSSFFAAMLEEIARHRGDVDCFAGDAVLVAFYPEHEELDADADTRTVAESDEWALPGSRQEREHGGSNALSAAVIRALACAKAVHARVDGFRHEPRDPPLRVHSGLAAGMLTAVACVGRVAGRSEGFVVGSPLSDLAIALKESSTSEIVLAPSAACLCAAAPCTGWSQRTLPTGYMVLRPELLHNILEGPDTQHLEESESRRHPCESSALCPLEEVVDRMQHEERLGRMRADTPSRRAKKSIGRRNDSLLFPQGGASTSGHRRKSGSVHKGDMGLDALLCFMPNFVRSQLLAGYNPSSLMEHRMVTILFIIADMEEHKSYCHDPAWLSSLQAALGSSIDAVEAQMGGATRQITVDDKGLAMIFVFGLPGYRSSNQTIPCILAGQKVLGLLAGAGVHGTAGITTGICFCGLVGDPKIRCEYAVMGDFVNTAARLAVAAAKQGDSILCSQAVMSATPADQLCRHELELQPAGSVKMKGKAEEASVFRPGPASYCLLRNRAARVFGRDQEMELLGQAVGGSHVGQAGVTLVAVTGDMGIGKTAVVEALLSQAKRAGEMRHWMLLRGAEEGGSAFIAVRDILRWVLQLYGEPQADTISWLLSDFSLGDSLPKLLRKHVRAIQGLRASTQSKTLLLQELYCGILWDALRDMPMVLLVEDADKMDAQSQNVLKAIAYKMQSAESEDTAAIQHSSVLLYTSRVLELPGWIATGRRSREGAGGVLSLALSPLPDEAIVCIAQASLSGCLDASISALVVERSAGIPLQAVELCSWLKTTELVVDGQLSAKAAGVDLASLVPPNMQKMVQAQVDQLPLVPGMVLRCASVLGAQFSAATLLSTFPTGILHDMEELEEQLGELCKARLMDKEDNWSVAAVRGQALSSTTYKFRNKLHQEVVYSSLPHHHRRKSHKMAAEAIKRQVQGVTGMPEVRLLLRDICQHLLLASRTTSTSDGSKYRLLDEEEVKDVEASLSRAAANSQDLGYYEESMIYRIQLLSLLKENNAALESASLVSLALESHVVDRMTGFIATMTIYDPAVLDKHVGEASEKLAELDKRQEKLQAQISQLHGEDKARQLAHQRLLRSPSRTPHNERKSHPPFPLMRRIAITTFMSKLALEFIKSKGFTKTLTAASLMDMMHEERPVMEAAYLGGHICIGFLYQATCWERITLGEIAYNAFEGANEPYQMTDLSGAPVVNPIVAMWLSGQLWSGHLGGAAETAASLAVELHAKENRSFLLTMWESFEASWNPVTSHRVATLHRQRVEATTPEKPWVFLAKSLDQLNKAQAAADALRPHLLDLDAGTPEKVTSGDPGVPGIAQSFATALSAAVQAAEDSVHGCALHFAHSPVAMTCVREICAILFPEALPRMPIASSPADTGLQLEARPLAPQGRLALRHLACVSDALSRCLECWARWAVNVHGVSSYLPSMLMSARSVLHLAQWVLLQAGHRRELPEAVPLRGGIHGYGVEASVCNVGQADDGPAAAAAGLLLAQRIGVARGELLVGCLPATVALTRLLLGEARPDVLRKGLHATSARLPESLPSAPASSERTSEDAPANLSEGAPDWPHVRFGSLAAKVLAKGYMESVLRGVVLRGQPLVLSELRGPADVADSESLWEAAALWKQMQQEQEQKVHGWTQ